MHDKIVNNQLHGILCKEFNVVVTAAAAAVGDVVILFWKQGTLKLL